MKYLIVISDTHGRVEKLKNLLPIINDADYLIFLGDCTGDLYPLKKEITVPIIAVNGNCDGIKAYEDKEVFEWHGHKLFIAHGHRYGVKRDLLDITYAAKEAGCDYALFGHTHEALIEEYDGVTLVNPGSLAEPRFSQASYCVITEEQGKIFPKIIYISA